MSGEGDVEECSGARYLLLERHLPTRGGRIETEVFFPLSCYES